MCMDFYHRNPDKYEQLSEGLLVFSEDRYHSLYNNPYFLDQYNPIKLSKRKYNINDWIILNRS